MGGELTPNWGDARSIGDAFVGSGVDFMKEAIAKKTLKPLEIVELCREYGPELPENELTDIAEELYENGLLSIVTGVARRLGDEPDRDNDGDVDLGEARKFIRGMRMINGEIVDVIVSGVQSDIIMSAAAVTDRAGFESRFDKLSKGEKVKETDREKFKDFIETNVVGKSLPPMKREEFETDEKFIEYERARGEMESFGHYSLAVLEEYSQKTVRLKNGTVTNKAALVIRAMGNMYEAAQGSLFYPNQPDLADLERGKATEESDPVILAEFSADIAIKITKIERAKPGATVDNLAEVFEGIQHAFVVAKFGLGNRPTMMNSINEVFTLITANGVDGIDLYGKERDAIGLFAEQINNGNLNDLDSEKKGGALSVIAGTIGATAGFVKYIAVDVGLTKFLDAISILSSGGGIDGVVTKLGGEAVQKIKQKFAELLLKDSQTDEILRGLGEKEPKIKAFLGRMLTMDPKAAGEEFDEMLQTEGLMRPNVKDVLVKKGGLMAAFIAGIEVGTSREPSEMFTIGFAFWVLGVNGKDVENMVRQYKLNPANYNRPLNGKNLALTMWEAEDQWKEKGGEKGRSWEEDIVNSSMSWMEQKVDKEMPYRTMWETLTQGTYESLVSAPLLMEIMFGASQGFRNVSRNVTGGLVALDLITDLRMYYTDHVEREALKNPGVIGGFWDKTGGFIVNEGVEIGVNRGQELIHQMWTMHLISRGLPESAFIELLKKAGFKAMTPFKWALKRAPFFGGIAASGTEFAGAKLAGLAVKAAGPTSFVFGVNIVWRDAILDLEYNPVTGDWEPSGEWNILGRGAAAVAGLLNILFGWEMTVEIIAKAADKTGASWFGKDSKFYRGSKIVTRKLGVSTPEKKESKGYRSRGLGHKNFDLANTGGFWSGEANGFEGSPQKRADKIRSVVIDPTPDNPKSGRIIIVEEVVIIDTGGSITGVRNKGVNAEHIVIREVVGPNPIFEDRRIGGRKMVTTWEVETSHRLVLENGTVIDGGSIDGLRVATETVKENPMDIAEKFQKEVGARKLEVNKKAKKGADDSTDAADKKKPLETKEFKSQYREQSLAYESSPGRKGVTITVEFTEKNGTTTSTSKIEVVSNTTKIPNEHTVKYTDASGTVQKTMFAGDLPPGLDTALDNLESSNKKHLKANPRKDSKVNSTLEVLKAGGLDANHPVSRFVELEIEVRSAVRGGSAGGGGRRSGGGSRSGGSGGGSGGPSGGPAGGPAPHAGGTPEATTFKANVDTTLANMLGRRDTLTGLIAEADSQGNTLLKDELIILRDQVVSERKGLLRAKGVVNKIPTTTQVTNAAAKLTTSNGLVGTADIKITSARSTLYPYMGGGSGSGTGTGTPRTMLEPGTDTGGTRTRASRPSGRMSVGSGGAMALDTWPGGFEITPLNEIFEHDLALAKKFLKKVYGDLLDISGIERGVDRLTKYLKKNKAPVLSAYEAEFAKVRVLDWAEAKPRLSAMRATMKAEMAFGILMAVGLMYAAYEQSTRFERDSISDSGFEFAGAMAGAFPAGWGTAMLGAKAFSGLGPVGMAVGALGFGFVGGMLGGDIGHKVALSMKDRYPYMARDIGRISQVFLQGGGFPSMVMDGIIKTDGTYGSFIAGETVGFAATELSLNDISGGDIPDRWDWHLPNLSKLEVRNRKAGGSSWWDREADDGYYKRLKHSEMPEALREMRAAETNVRMHPGDEVYVEKYEKKKAVYEPKKAELDTLEVSIAAIEAGADPTETEFANKYLEREAAMAEDRETLQDFTRSNLRAYAFPERIADTASLALDRLPDGPEGWLLAGEIEHELDVIDNLEDQVYENREYFKIGALEETLEDAYSDLETFYPQYDEMAVDIALNLEEEIGRLEEANYDARDILIDVKRNEEDRGYFAQRSARKDAEKVYEESREALAEATRNLDDLSDPHSEFAKKHPVLGDVANAVAELEKQIDKEKSKTVSSMSALQSKFSKAKSLYGTSDIRALVEDTERLYSEALARTTQSYGSMKGEMSGRSRETMPDKITFTETEARMLMRLAEAEEIESEYFMKNRDLSLLTASYVSTDEFWFGSKDEGEGAHNTSVEIHEMNTFGEPGSFDPKKGHQAEDSFIYGHRSGEHPYETNDQKIIERSGYKLLDEMTLMIPGKDNRNKAKEGFFGQIMLAEKIFYESSLYAQFGVFNSPTQWRSLDTKENPSIESPERSRAALALVALDEKYQKVKGSPDWRNEDGLFDYDRLIDEFEMPDFDKEG